LEEEDMDRNAGKDQSSSARLAELGHTQKLDRSLSVAQVVSFGLADVSPTLTVIYFASAAFAVAGTFVVAGGIFLSVVVVFTGMCLAELASIYPLSGGIFAIVGRTLPPPFKWMMLAVYLMTGVLVVGSPVVGIAAFLNGLFPGLHASQPVVVIVVMVLVTALSLTRVKLSAWTTFYMVGVELFVLIVLAFAAILHAHNSIGQVIFQPQYLSNGKLLPVGVSVMLVALVPLYNVIAGYDGVMGFAEELKGGTRAMGKAVMWTASLTGIAVMIPIIAITIAAPNLKDFFQAPIPAIYALQSTLGSGVTSVIDAVACVALFNVSLVAIMYYTRVLFGTATEGVWPDPVDRVLSHVNRFQVPDVCAGIMIVITLLLSLVASLDSILILAGAFTAAMFFGVGLSALVSRFTDRDVDRPFRMPIWPFPPIVVLVVTGVALVQEGWQYAEPLLIALAVGLVGWGLSHLWHAGTPDVVTPTVVVEPTP
jgi:amino acid transporter